MVTKILIVDDEPDLARLLEKSLAKEGYKVVPARDGVEALQLLRDHNPQLVLLDLLMPRMDGWETCHQIRQISSVPIILLTALDGEREKVSAFELGADDYITKPFSLMELVARIRAALRRCNPALAMSPVVRVDDRLALDRPNRQVVVAGQPVELSPIEYRLLGCFLDNAGRILSHQSLLTQVWGWEHIDEVDYLKVYVHHLRKKIEENPARPQYIVTERGLGYRFQHP